jgi:hypothetical protein
LLIALDSELSFDLGDASAEAALDLCDGRNLSAEVVCVVEVLQVGPQLIEKFAGETMAHGQIILPQKECIGEFLWAQSPPPGRLPG